MTSFVLHLLRHGEPEGAGALIGRTDAASTVAGIAACVTQAQGLKAPVLIASDLSRARLAGEAIGAAAGTALAIDPRWRELDFGTWDGKPPADIDNAALARFWDDPDVHAPPGGECWSALKCRVSAAVGDLAPRATLIVTHAGAMRAALAVLCGFDARQVWAFDLPYAGLLSLRVWPGANPVAQIMGLRP
ncbi:histidine phosphatase family protein [Novosphingobium sp. EMRT-2]|uniref:histidine phosphatase family protein n=1 Tax=Novosphingobium sp. EMRT-2 TaxID=2571749 RepID=UPI0010BCEFA1|nr:histidine phosphatase family protein [Novosphingobium sp. EMRT-2]QCI92366.1 histidine phosphatase family protein [Novosphingobium sp. EMRT-2]